MSVWHDAPDASGMWWVRREGQPDDVLRVTRLDEHAVWIHGTLCTSDMIRGWQWCRVLTPERVEALESALRDQLAEVERERDALASGAEDVRLALLDVVRHITADPCDGDEQLAAPVAALIAAIDDSADGLHDTIDLACKQRDSAIAELERLRAIIAGRTTPPTDAEIEAHDGAGCGWWPLSDDGRPCAWPVVPAAKGGA